MRRPVVVLRAIRSGTPTDVLGGELVMPGASELSAFQRLQREHPRCWIERRECDGRRAAEALLGINPTLPAWLEVLGWAVSYFVLIGVAVAIGLWTGWLRV